MRRTTNIIGVVATRTAVSTTPPLTQEMAEPPDTTPANEQTTSSSADDNSRVPSLAGLERPDRTDHRASGTTRRRHPLRAAR
jgi:hypothetical protein